MLRFQGPVHANLLKTEFIDKGKLGPESDDEHSRKNSRKTSWKFGKETLEFGKKGVL